MDIADQTRNKCERSIDQRVIVYLSKHLNSLRLKAWLVRNSIQSFDVNVQCPIWLSVANTRPFSRFKSIWSHFVCLVFGFYFLYNIHQCESIYIFNRQTLYWAEFWIIYYYYFFSFLYKIWQWKTKEEQIQRKRTNHRSPFINYKSNAAGLVLGLGLRYYVWFRLVYSRYIRIRYNFTLCTTTYHWAQNWLEMNISCAQITHMNGNRGIQDMKDIRARKYIYIHFQFTDVSVHIGIYI